MACFNVCSTGARWSVFCGQRLQLPWSPAATFCWQSLREGWCFGTELECGMSCLSWYIRTCYSVKERFVFSLSHHALSLSLSVSLFLFLSVSLYRCLILILCHSVSLMTLCPGDLGFVWRVCFPLISSVSEEVLTAVMYMCLMVQITAVEDTDFLSASDVGDLNPFAAVNMNQLQEA